MREPLSELLQVATPCDEDWDTMVPVADRARHCSSCDHAVYDTSEMTRAELVRLTARPDRPCLRLVVRDADGAVLVADGYVSAPSRMRRHLPLLGALASVGLAACSHAPVAEDAAIPPVATSAVTPQAVPSQVVAEAPDASVAPADASVPDAAPADAGHAEQCDTVKTPHPGKPVPPQHHMLKGKPVRK